MIDRLITHSAPCNIFFTCHLTQYTVTGTVSHWVGYRFCIINSGGTWQQSCLQQLQEATLLSFINRFFKTQGLMKSGRASPGAKMSSRKSHSGCEHVPVTCWQDPIAKPQIKCLCKVSHATVTLSEGGLWPTKVKGWLAYCSRDISNASLMSLNAKWYRINLSFCSILRLFWTSLQQWHGLKKSL